jgi:hypothetical protein
LSISRLQALAWTLVIFGAFAGAMLISQQVTASNWIHISGDLLGLAGISLGTGVFSSLIAAVNDEQKTAMITGIGPAPPGFAPPAAPGAPAAAALPPGQSYVIITGQDLGKSGSVRFNNTTLAPVVWQDDRIVVVLHDGSQRTPLVVDTSNGKVCHDLTGQAPNLILGPSRLFYEASDLFRDDKDPATVSLMKFQMFGWTMVAIVVYVIMFLAKMNGSMTELPGVDSSIVALTGISQAGYLTGKGVSNVKK